MSPDTNEKKYSISSVVKEQSKMWKGCTKKVTKIKYSLEAIKCKFDTTKYLSQFFRVQTWEVISDYKVNK